MAINEKMKPTTKFKVGDRVKILPSAVDVGVSKSEVGTIQTVIEIIGPDTIDITDSGDWSWWVESHHIELITKVGQQLLFEFMEIQE